MLINNENAERRLKNPLNLINRERSERKTNAMSLFIRPSVSEEKKTNIKIENKLMVPPRVESEEIVENSISSSLSLALEKVTHNPTLINPTPAPVESENIPSPIDNLINNADSTIELASAHNKAITLMGKAMGKLEKKLDEDVVPAKMLPSIISGLGKVVTDIRKEQNDRNNRDKNETTIIHFYCPEQRKVNEYEVIDVG